MCWVTCLSESFLAHWQMKLYYWGDIPCHLDGLTKTLLLFSAVFVSVGGVEKWLIIPCGSSRWPERQANYSLTAAVGSH